MFEQEQEGAERAWQMEVVLVRTAQRLLDAAAGLPCVDAHLETVHEPCTAQACAALRSLAPALAHLVQRACARRVLALPGSTAWHGRAG